MPTSIGTNKKEFEEQIEKLQKGLKGTYTKEQIGILFNQTKRFKIVHLTKTVEHLLITKTFLPPANDIISGCRVEAYSDEQEEDREEAQFARDLFDGKIQPHGEIAKDSMELILGSLKGKTTKNQLYKKMLDMEGIYPGMGWRAEAQKLKQEERE